MKIFIQHLKKNAVLYAALTLALVSSIIIKPSIVSIQEAIDWRVLSLLFCLMAIVSAFIKYNVLDVIAVSLLRKCKNTRSLYITLVFLVFFVSMAVTNDVALLTFVPLTLILCSKAKIPAAMLIILETIAANLGSSVTPMGNPQNLFLYSYYTMNASLFFSHTVLIAFPSVFMLITVILIVTNKRNDQKGVTIEHISLQNPVRIIFSILVLIVILLSVFRIIDYRMSLIITIAFLFLCERDLFKKVDYSLLFTFIGFFIFTDNIAQVEVISLFIESILQSNLSVYIAGISISQIISNVPAALLLSGFTEQAESLLLGVNVGGLGTLVASLASVISYKLYTTDNGFKDITKGKNSYIRVFVLLNILFLVILVPLVWFLKTIL